MPMRRWMVLRLGLLVAAAWLLPLGAGAAVAAGPPAHLRGFGHERVCTAVPAGRAHCNAEVLTDATASPLVTPGPAGYGPADLQAAYGLVEAAAARGGTQTVAVVDAFDAPTAEQDLAEYRSQFGLPACTTANGCFRKVNQDGGSTPPAVDPAWAQETALDLDMVSAICPRCQILLVEADSDLLSDLAAAVQRAAAMGATQISNSYGGREFRGETRLESAYDHPGVAVTVSSGDAGYGTEFPAASRYVTAVGGTSLVPSDTAARGWSETAWSGAGSGCSTYVPKPEWQKDTGCARRTIADVAAVADPATGVAVYDSLDFEGASGWMVFGGTSAAAPIVAAFDALVGSAAASPSFAYANASSYFDVVSGRNGTCGTAYLCTAAPGIDGPTGVGTPSGALAAGPSARTDPASAVTDGAATLNGVVDAYGTATSWRFEYGTTTDYGEQASGAEAIGPGAGLSVAARISRLLPNTTYHYRLVAENAAATAAGTDRTFRTAGAPSVAANAAESIDATSAQLAGSVNPDGLPTTYRFEYGTTTGYGGRAPAVDADAGSGRSEVTVTAPLAGLQPETTYHYRLVAVNAAGTSASGDRTFATASAAPADDPGAVGTADTVAADAAGADPGGDPTGSLPLAGDAQETPPLRLSVARVPPLRPRTLRRRGLRVRVSCTAGCRVTATLRRRGRATALGRGRLALEASARGRVTIRLSPRGRRLLRGARVTKLVLTLVARDAAGRRRTVTRRVRLRRASLSRG